MKKLIAGLLFYIMLTPYSFAKPSYFWSCDIEIKNKNDQIMLDANLLVPDITISRSGNKGLAEIPAHHLSIEDFELYFSNRGLRAGGIARETSVSVTNNKSVGDFLKTGGSITSSKVSGFGESVDIGTTIFHYEPTTLSNGSLEKQSVSFSVNQTGDIISTSCSLTEGSVPRISVNYRSGTLKFTNERGGKNRNQRIVIE